MASTHHLPDWKIAVVGSGAMGCYYGGLLANRGRDVHFLMRSDFEQVKKRGLRVKSKQGDFHLQGVHCYKSTEEIGPVDLVIIALKTTANDLLQELIKPLLKEDTMLLTLQNGLGSDELLAEHFGADRVLGALCFVCINRTAPGEIQHIGAGRVSIGEFAGYTQARTHDIASEFKRCGIVCSVVDDLARERWKKLVWNIPFNGLSIAAGGISTDQILADPALAQLARGLMRETIAAARALGHELPSSLVQQMIDVTKPMGAYRPSSLIDFQNGGEVEIDTIWGEPVRRGFNAGAEVGRIEALHLLILHAVAARDASTTAS